MLEKEVPGSICGKTLDYFPKLLSRLAGDDLTAPPLGNDDLAALMFTLGSTGVPRGVMVTHGNIMANGEPAEKRRRKSHEAGAKSPVI